MRVLIERAISGLKNVLFFRRHNTPTIIPHRNNGQEVAFLLVHGFGGNTRATWSQLVDLVRNDTSITTWDLFGVGYATSLRIDVPHLWAADPSLTLLARGLRTTLSLPPLAEYGRIAIAAHSMGGLLVQRAILDDEGLRSRVSHVFLFGSPSNGLEKARPLGRFKRQLRDMASDSDFIMSLRSDWNRIFGDGFPFLLRVIAGDRDEFVPATSSLSGFDDSDLAVVPGDHLEIVKPTRRDDPSLVLIVDALTGSRRALPAIDSARLAIERGRFQQAIATLMPRVNELDNSALAGLALALEATGRHREALAILEQRYNHGGGLSTTDAMGVMAGRLKRRWLTERVATDLTKARNLYRDALQLAEENGDHAQAYYHAINVAFLDLSALPEASEVSPEVRVMAQRALEHCRQAAPHHWRDATQGEALLMLGELERAEETYRQAVASVESPRDMDSMYSQAIRVAERVFGRRGITRMEKVFGVYPSTFR